MQNFQVVEENGQFKVRDEEGINYGAYPTRIAAEEAIEGWIEYYSSPLPDAPNV